MAHGYSERLIQVKQALAAKYERLAELTPSRPRRTTYTNRAGRYRRQIADIRRQIGQQ